MLNLLWTIDSALHRQQKNAKKIYDQLQYFACTNDNRNFFSISEAAMFFFHFLIVANALVSFFLLIYGQTKKGTAVRSDLRHIITTIR